MKNRFLFFFLLSSSLTPDQTTIVKENSILNSGEIDHNRASQTIFNRPKQNIAIRGGGNGEDLVTHIEYENLGRQEKEYLPYPVVGNQGEYPYSQKEFEESPLKSTKTSIVSKNEYHFKN